MNTKKCPKCGKELPAEAGFCPYCMEKFNLEPSKEADNSKSMKKLLIICVSVLAGIIIIVSGTVAAITVLNHSAPDNQAISETSAVTSEPTDKTKESSENDSKGESKTGDKTVSLDSDNGIGLRNIKVDSSDIKTENQKIIAQYFDNDYIDITDSNYEFLARYPSIFEGSQICFTGTVQKIIKSNDNDYEMLVWIGKNEPRFYYRSNNTFSYDTYKENTKDNLIIIKGNQSDARLIVGDDIVVYGRYGKIETQTIDGVSYTIPTANAYRTFFNTGISLPNKFDENFIKKTAKALFGDDIEVRNASDGEDYDSSAGAGRCNFEDHPFMICEPENQSNSKFTKYRLYMKQGVVEDAKSKSSVYGTGTSVDDSKIIRKIEFAPDFEHYLIYTFDTELNSLSVGYYDKNFNKVWQRDFEETVNGVYDYTDKCFYIVANNDLYIIEMSTGKDVKKPSYVGAKSDIRKVHDGLIMFSEEKTDSVMKTDLNGDIVWKTNIMNENYTVLTSSIQFISERIIISNNFVCFELDLKTGKLLTTGERIN